MKHSFQGYLTNVNPPPPVSGKSFTDLRNANPSYYGYFPSTNKPYNINAAMKAYLPQAQTIANKIFGAIKAPPGYGDSINAKKMYQTRANQVLDVLNNLISKSQWAYQQEIKRKQWEEENERRQQQYEWQKQKAKKSSKPTIGGKIINPWVISSDYNKY